MLKGRALSVTISVAVIVWWVRCYFFTYTKKTKERETNKKDLLGGESNPGQPGDSRLYLTTILPKISHLFYFILFF